MINEHETRYDMILCMRYLIHYCMDVRIPWMREITPWPPLRGILGSFVEKVITTQPFSKNSNSCSSWIELQYIDVLS